MRPRASGVLLHPTSLPGRYGIGELGDSARSFVEFLHETGQSVWQVLPLGPTGYGDSPYQCFSAFAGNPLLVSVEDLVGEGLLGPGDLTGSSPAPVDVVDFGAVIAWKLPILRRAAEAFERLASPSQRGALDEFRRVHASWLEDFTLFMALKGAHGGAPWPTWETALAIREPRAVAAARERHAAEIRVLEFTQYAFFRQWLDLKARCRRRGVRIVGDLPIFVAHDSADVWAHPELFQLAADGAPSFVAGVPPDYFSATGQLWGNPLYRWDVLARTGYRWWIDRFRATLSLVDVVRLDHFRGFESYWEVPAGQETAERGRWVKGPGAALFESLEAALGPLPVIAENLGVITPEVESLRERFSWPGMAILQFAFGSDDPSDTFKPHNYPRNRVAYTGTHDNDTIVGWWSAGVGDTTRSAAFVEAERALCRRYLGTDGREIHWAMIRAALASVADTVVVPLQDVLGIGSEGRMNLPGRGTGNWRWRFRAEAITPGMKARLADLTHLYGRFRVDSRART